MNPDDPTNDDTGDRGPGDPDAHDCPGQTCPAEPITDL